MKKNKMEEIQARRGFFKSASKGAMPVMTMLDTTTSAKVFGGGSNLECGGSSCTMVCGNSCSDVCRSDCGGGCRNTCEGCKGSCKNVSN
ncbi:MAG: hypothetical protein FWD60_03670 [Candidatus Azobacteroides sp.]|nr:hypothetical protein [Candidatus Azobacteroides sp.]